MKDRDSNIRRHLLYHKTGSTKVHATNFTTWLLLTSKNYSRTFFTHTDIDWPIISTQSEYMTCLLSSTYEFLVSKLSTIYKLLRHPSYYSESSIKPVIAAFAERSSTNCSFSFASYPRQSQISHMHDDALGNR